MTDQDSTEPAERPLKPGQRVYDNTGREIGVVQGITESGVEVTTHTDIGTLSLKHAPRVNLGEGYLVWRCSECGEVGDIEQIPDRCPSCGISKEALYAYLED